MKITRIHLHLLTNLSIPGMADNNNYNKDKNRILIRNDSK